MPIPKRRNTPAPKRDSPGQKSKYNRAKDKWDGKFTQHGMSGWTLDDTGAVVYVEEGDGDGGGSSCIVS